MKKFLLTFVALLLTATVALAAEASYTISFMSKPSDNAGTSLSNSDKVFAEIENGSEYVSSFSTITQIYGKSKYGLRIGSSSKTGKLVIELSKKGQVKATRVVLKAAKYSNDTGSFKVNDKSSSESLSKYSELHDFEYTLNGTIIKNLTIETTAKRGYLNAVTVYYEDESDPRENTKLSFSQESYEFDMADGTFEAPQPIFTPAEAAGALTFTSSNTSVADVDETTGAVTPKMAGTTTITAEFAGNEAYTGAKAEYLLKVSNSNISWNLVTTTDELKDGDIIAIVCNTKDVALSNSTGSSSSANYFIQTTITVSEDKKTIEDNGDILRFEVGKTVSNNTTICTFKSLNMPETTANGYLCGNAKTKIILNASITDNCKSTVTIAKNGIADLKFGSYFLRYNAASPRFTIYESGQTDIQLYKYTDKSLVAQLPEVTVEKTANAYELTAEGIPAAEFEYAVSQDGENAPDNYEISTDGIIDPKTLDLKDGTNYLWARVLVGEAAGEATMIATIEHDAAIVEEAAIYEPVIDQSQMVDSHWYVIGVRIGNKCYVMGPNGASVAVTLIDGKLAGYLSHFDGKINEYQHVGGVFTIKHEVNGYNKVQRREAAENSVTINEDGTATIVMNGETLGHDGEAFSTAGENKGLMLFTTGKDVNTGVDNVAATDAAAEVEYYNLQGIKVAVPTHGLYIMKQGSTATTILIK